MTIAAKLITEGLGLGVLLSLVCAFGIRRGAIGMVHLYGANVQERAVKLGLITAEKIRKNSIRVKCICIPGYLVYLVVCVYGINHARGFVSGFWQMLVILSIMNLIDRFLSMNTGSIIQRRGSYPEQKTCALISLRRIRNANGSWERPVWQ